MLYLSLSSFVETVMSFLQLLTDKLSDRYGLLCNLLHKTCTEKLFCYFFGLCLWLYWCLLNVYYSFTCCCAVPLMCFGVLHSWGLWLFGLLFLHNCILYTWDSSHSLKICMSGGPRDSKLYTGMNMSMLFWQPVQGVSLPSAKCMLG